MQAVPARGPGGRLPACPALPVSSSSSSSSSQKSTLESYRLCSITSGAIQNGVPTKVSRFPLSVSVNCAETPKSAILTFPLSDSRMFAAAVIKCAYKNFFFFKKKSYLKFYFIFYFIFYFNFFTHSRVKIDYPCSFRFDTHINCAFKQK